MSELDDAAAKYAEGAFTDANFKLPEVVKFAFLAGAAWQREQDAGVALEQRCERGTPWDGACVEIAAKIRAQGSKQDSEVKDGR